MQATLNMLLAAISDLPSESRVADQDGLRVSGITLFCKGRRTDDVPEERLIVCSAADAPAAALIKGYGAIVCVCGEGGVFPDNAPRETVAVFAGAEPAEIYQRLNERYIRIMDWRMRMAEGMTNGCSLQEIMEMSKDMIGNYIAVSDNTFRLVANTANIPCDDVICQRMIKHGYHPESVVAKFRSTGRVKFWEEHDFYIDNGHLFSPYTLVGRIFRMNGEYMAHAVMTCNNRDATPDVIDLYNMLCEFIAKFAARDWENQNAELVLYSSLLSDLLSGSATDFEQVKERMAQNGFPSDVMCLVRIPVNAVANTLVGRLSKDVSELFSHVHIALYQQELVLLIGAEEGSYDAADREALEFFKLLEKYELTCGVSSFFDDVSQIGVAYMQAKEALNSGDRLRRSAHIEQLRTRYPHAFRFDEYLPYCLLDNSYDVIRQWLLSDAGRALSEIEELDRKNGSNNLQLLYTYLMNERRAKETGEAMHLHRNSVVYRIEHLRDAVHLGDLEDANVRTGLLMSLLMYNLCGGDE